MELFVVLEHIVYLNHVLKVCYSVTCSVVLEHIVYLNNVFPAPTS